MQKKIIETSFRVRYAETDASGVVYHANYLIWFEVGRGEWFWQQGRDYHRDVQARGLQWPVTEAAVRFNAPARYGERVTVRTWMEDLQSRAFKIAYEVVNAETRELLCAGWTKHFNVDSKTGHAVALPEELKKFLAGE
ncbi:MAG: acyl-CoA thioesterase [Chloroflexi bacterium]|nr:acyl-CoA thioesterase [Chloroflexota bacterium]